MRRGGTFLFCASGFVRLTDLFFPATTNGGSRESPSGEGQQTQTSVEGDRAGWIVGVITLRPCNTHIVVSTIWITYSSIRRPIVVTEARGRPQDFK